MNNNYISLYISGQLIDYGVKAVTLQTNNNTIQILQNHVDIIGIAILQKYYNNRDNYIKKKVIFQYINKNNVLYIDYI